MLFHRHHKFSMAVAEAAYKYEIKTLGFPYKYCKKPQYVDGCSGYFGCGSLYAVFVKQKEKNWEKFSDESNFTEVEFFPRQCLIFGSSAHFPVD